MDAATKAEMLAHCARIASDNNGTGRLVCLLPYFLINSFEHRPYPFLFRPIAELLKTRELLKGYESQRLRTYCTSTSFQPAQHLDTYGMQLFMGHLPAVKADFTSRVDTRAGSESDDERSAKIKAAQELFELR